MKLLLYCNKTKSYLVYGSEFNGGSFIDKYCLTKGYSKQQVDEIWGSLNGKIIGECDFEVEEITYKDDKYYFEFKHAFDSLRESCLSFTELANYLNQNNGYAIHIKNLHIFDSPKELNELYSIHNIGGMLLTDKLKKASQNMQRISLHEWEYGTFNPNDVAILISISSQEFCEILNGEKTIVIKKKVLKEML